MTTENIQIQYLPYVSYNQEQAEILGLNHTEAILMTYFAYFLPNFGVHHSKNKKNYYWLTYGKIFNDMPTIEMSDNTLRRYINGLIKKDLLERILVTKEKNKTRAFYKATDNYLMKKRFTPFNFGMLYNHMETLLKEGKVYADEREKLSKLVSSYKGKKKKAETTFNYDKIKGTAILDYLAEEFKLSEKGEGVIIDVGKEINYDYVQKYIVDVIIENGKDYGWIKHKINGVGLDINDEVKGKILGNLKKMFGWLKEKKKPVKDWGGNIRTWFGKSWI